MRNIKATIQRGFTMVELIIVIVILGVLAAAATIGYNSLQKGAEQAQAEGLAAQLTSLASANYAASIPSSSVAGTSYTQASSCSSLTGGGSSPYTMSLPSGYSAAVSGSWTSGKGTSNTCTITSPSGLTADATVIATT
jgi:prepilin-type N-terminal cleavage/methylation domain-containing protein